MILNVNNENGIIKKASLEKNDVSGDYKLDILFNGVSRKPDYSGIEDDDNVMGVARIYDFYEDFDDDNNGKMDSIEIIPETMQEVQYLRNEKFLYLIWHTLSYSFLNNSEVLVWL